MVLRISEGTAYVKQLNETVGEIFEEHLRTESSAVADSVMRVRKQSTFSSCLVGVNQDCTKNQLKNNVVKGCITCQVIPILSRRKKVITLFFLFWGSFTTDKDAHRSIPGKDGYSDG